MVAVPRQGRAGPPAQRRRPADARFGTSGHRQPRRRAPSSAKRLRTAAFLIGTNLLDEEAWPDGAVIALYHEQAVVERGFAFLKDPLFLASSVFVKKPERIMALAFIMVLCLLVYKLAEVRVRQRLVATGQTVPDQVGKPTARPTMRWLFQCFEGIDLHHRCCPMAHASPRSSVSRRASPGLTPLRAGL